ncbi:hypothetical protein CEUSTIGMA_g1011.t1 [Chlamydomonas eustigma]|uniref:methionine--tRNA ligase n=1 Tax=Chlamydomonas eustigma TaxID=1157962 RepID=A0A250WSQ2_9CHLO|nr:hypothetical protein CEUSTIGMA_g1011.t1 [Chlamydomonas eustigma]|eukprot:GAX73560.1 hypothetical protein CEUSTIGMA_g1011.t1 [Chlamydomonas eustigma]
MYNTNFSRAPMRSCLKLRAHGTFPFNVQHSALGRNLKHVDSTVGGFKYGICDRRRRHLSATAAKDVFTITTPLYYVNAAPHMGSAYPTIAADTLARFQRLQGQTVHFLTGTDEHGEKIALAAEKRGMSPQAHCDSIVQEYRTLWELLDIKYDHFVRTTEAKHTQLVHEVLKKVWDKGDIYKADYEGWYCVDCEEFKDEKEMDEHKNCPTHRKPCQLRKEGNYFFRLSRYQNEIEQLLTSNEDFVQPAARRNELLAFVKEGVRDFSISRSAVTWGIPIPQDPEQTVYVWFDALNGYLSGLLPEGIEPSPESLSAAGWPATLHVIGKDILRFHAVYWPGMLLSAGLPLPGKVFGHGFLTKDGLKMGKSLGNVIDPVALVRAYGADAVRFYFMKETIFGQDGDFSEQRFRDVVNAALANNIGNMLQRTLSLLHRDFGGRIVVGSDTGLSPDHPFRALAKEQVQTAHTAYSTMSFHEAVEAIVLLCSKGNQYLDETKPWTALKKGSDEEKAAASAVLCAVLELLRVAAVALQPVTPSLSRRVYSQLGYSDAEFEVIRWTDAVWGGLKEGHQTAQPAAIFGRMEGDFVTEPAPAAAASASSGVSKDQPAAGKKQKAAKPKVAVSSP